MGYEVVEHIGDVKVRVTGESKEQLFRDAAVGMFAVLQPRLRQGSDGQGKVKRIIKIDSPEINALLVDFLSELNYLRQVNREAYDRIEIKKFSDTQVQAELFGYEVKEFAEDIKAVTFHDLDIKQDEQGIWETFIVFDV